MQDLVKQALEDLKDCSSLALLTQIKAKYLGKKSYYSELMNEIRNIPNSEKKAFGQKTNELRINLEQVFDEAKKNIEEMLINQAIENEKIDITLPGKKILIGNIHPLEKVIREVSDLFIEMGYIVAVGPEVEIDEYNFEKLNIPKDHPARDMQDSFFLDANRLLRTHTSPVQIRTMLESNGEPIKIICPGKVYRRDADDPTHSHQFMQIEGLVIGQKITFSDLKGTLLLLAKKLFGDERQIRLRPSYFPFTEPSVEVDVSCAKCDNKGCSICKNTGWIEILGAGMVHNNVLKACGYDANKIQGFAFGVGVERITMLKYRIDDIRHFYVNDIRFLQQFK